MIFINKKTALHTAISLLVSLSIGLIISQQQSNRILRENMFLQKENLVYTSNYLSNVTNKRFALLFGLKAYIKTKIETETPILWKEFNIIAKELYVSTKGVRNISIAVGGVQQFVYPLSGNESVLQHDLINDERPNVRKDVQRAIQSGQITISGPYEIRQGGLAMVARLAIFHNDNFWGLINMVLDIPPILEESGLTDINSPINISIKKSDGIIFWGDEQIFNKEHVEVVVDLPDGNWVIAGYPVDEWYNKSGSMEILIIRLAVIILSFLISFIVYLITNKQQNLILAVNRSTKELTVVNNSLEKKILEHTQAEEDLKNYHDHLEELVAKRTDELKEKNAELEEKTATLEISRQSLTFLLEDVNEVRSDLEEKNAELKQFNKIFIDREFRIKELRDRVKQLEENGKK